MAKATPYDPKNLSTTSGIVTLYVTPTSGADAFIEAYPSGQTLAELSPVGDTCAPGTLSTTTWP